MSKHSVDRETNPRSFPLNTAFRLIHMCRRLTKTIGCFISCWDWPECWGRFRLVFHITCDL